MSDRSRNLRRKACVQVRRAKGKLKSPSTQWYHYSLDFSHDGPFSPFPDDGEMAAIHASCNAERTVYKKAEKAGLEVQHQYSWTDGSLYLYARTPQAMTIQQLRRIFDCPVVGLMQATLQDNKRIIYGEMISIEERFTLSRGQQWNLRKKRQAERDLFMVPYYDHRKSCPVGNCSKSGYLGCDVAMAIIDQCRHNQDNYDLQLSGQPLVEHQPPQPVQEETQVYAAHLCGSFNYHDRRALPEKENDSND